eukprot:5789920-Pleurochrysis_carterae.AAC.4
MQRSGPPAETRYCPSHVNLTAVTCAACAASLRAAALYGPQGKRNKFTFRKSSLVATRVRSGEACTLATSVPSLIRGRIPCTGQPIGRLQLAHSTSRTNDESHMRSPVEMSHTIRSHRAHEV